MKSLKYVIEVDKKRYAVEACFSGEPAIYIAGGEFKELGHISEPKNHSTVGYFGGEDEKECVFILARRIADEI